MLLHKLVGQDICISGSLYSVNLLQISKGYKKIFKQLQEQRNSVVCCSTELLLVFILTYTRLY